MTRKYSLAETHDATDRTPVVDIERLAALAVWFQYSTQARGKMKEQKKEVLKELQSLNLCKKPS